ncbi:MAG: sensor histidine kinase [Candidatus Binatia bacterium]
MAVLASMVEGVLVVDERNRVVVINAAAAQLLRCDASKAAGKPLVELVRLPSLQRFVDATLQSAASREDEVIIDDGGRRHLQLHGSRLADPAGQGSTAVVVLHDVTRLRRLETVRREFVANVSHELKTPITSVQGFLDTLRDGAVDDPATARRFVEIAGRQADRLGAIIEDLLTLSRLEEASGGLSSTVQTRPLAPTLKAAIQICQHKADAKGIALSLDCPPDLTARFDPALLEQALINLIDNAVKYSPENTRVGIGGTAAGGAAEISVADEGCGIEAQHLPRLFERFYRVDKARSRNLGGTGLGLAIVKHIAQVHGATVTVNSEPGRGTVFVFRLPPLETKPEEFPS